MKKTWERGVASELFIGLCLVSLSDRAGPYLLAEVSALIEV